MLHARHAAYAAGLDDELWPSALAALSPLFGATGTTLEVVARQDMALLDFWSHGLPPGGKVHYVEHYMAINPRVTHGLRLPACRRDGIGYDGLTLGEAEMDRDPFYAEFLRGAGLRYYTSATLAQTPDTYAVFTAQRPAGQGHVAAREVALMRELMPHLREAFDMTTRLRRAERKSHAFESALDWLVDGAALIASDGKILYANRAMQTIAARNDGLRIMKGRFEFTAATTVSQYEQAIGRLDQTLKGRLGIVVAGDLAVPRPSNAPPYLLSVRPLTRAGLPSRVDGRARALVFVRDPARPHMSSIALLRAMFGLTEAEAALAIALQSGTSLVDYARGHGLSLNTVYTHARRIREKTRTKRQAELIQKLKDLEIPVRNDKQ